MFAKFQGRSWCLRIVSNYHFDEFLVNNKTVTCLINFAFKVIGYDRSMNDLLWGKSILKILEEALINSQNRFKCFCIHSEASGPLEASHLDSKRCWLGLQLFYCQWSSSFYLCGYVINENVNIILFQCILSSVSNFSKLDIASHIVSL